MRAFLFIGLILCCSCAGSKDQGSPAQPKQPAKQPQTEETHNPPPQVPIKNTEKEKYVPFIYSSSTRRAIRLRIDDASNTFGFETCKLKPEQEISLLNQSLKAQCSPISPWVATNEMRPRFVELFRSRMAEHEAGLKAVMLSGYAGAGTNLLNATVLAALTRSGFSPEFYSYFVSVPKRAVLLSRVVPWVGAIFAADFLWNAYGSFVVIDQSRRPARDLDLITKRMSNGDQEIEAAPVGDVVMGIVTKVLDQTFDDLYSSPAPSGH